MNDSLDEIAIVGMAGCFPGAKNIEQFWQNLRDGVESISFFTDEELVSSGIDPAVLSQPNYVKARAVIEDIDLFDASFFGFSPREAEITDPQHRLFLECAWQALENAGYDSQRYAERIGVYAGVSLSTYFLSNLYPNQNLIESVGSYQTAIANSQDFLPTQVSYKLNLTGPSINIQTACSTSLVAVHLACQSLLNGESDLALAGGVSLNVPQKAGYPYQEGGIMSFDGHCRAFDAKAQGTVVGNGVGIVVLKRLEDAIADRDCIHAVIKGSTINNDGSLKVGFTAPSIDGQAQVIAEALAMARIKSDTVSYVEAHGTGTILGDPIEIAALTKSFQVSTNKKNFCAIGSVKTNIGHLDAAAGVASLIKTTLALKHKLIPPSLHFEQPNPQIDFANSPFYINNKLLEWKANGTPRRAGVSSFGIGGTNAHVIVEEAPIIEPSSTGRSPYLLVISAKTSSALKTAKTNLVKHLQQHPKINFADVAYTLAVGRREFEHRCIVVCQDQQDAVKILENPESQKVFSQLTEPREQQVVFMFPGQGAQYVGMGQELYQTEPIFREQFDYCCDLLKPHLEVDIRQIIYPSPEQTQVAEQLLKQTYITQPALFVIEYALAKLWMSWGVHPQAAIGHSIGEYVAATLAGVFSLKDALWLVATRGKLMQETPPGKMLAVPLKEIELKSFLSEEISLAASNAPSLCVVSGSESAIDNLQNQLARQGVECRPLHTSGAFHSSMMDAIAEPFITQVKKVNLNPPKIPFISNVTGTWITDTQATDPSYWAKHLRQTIRFAEGIAKLMEQSNRILLEVGPGRTLSTLAKRHSAKNVAIPSLRHPQDQQSDVAFLLNSLGCLWLEGIAVNWSGFYANEQRHRIVLPTYPFERQRFWIEPQSANLAIKSPPRPALAQLWSSLIEAGKTEAIALIQEFDQQVYLKNKQKLEDLCTAYMNLTLRRLGAFSNSFEQYSFTELVEQCQIIPRYQQLLSRWLEVLVERGHLQQKQEIFSHLLSLLPEDLNALLQEVKLNWIDTPEVVDIVEQCGENLTTVLIGKKEPLELYFAAADKRPETANAEFLNTYFQAIIRAVLVQIVNFLPPEVNLRILEIGGGQGIVTRELLPVLPSKQTKYTFTDIGRFFLNQAQKKFSTYPFIEYQILDIEESPTEQGYSSHSCDLVIAVNVLHITRNIDKTLEHIKSLLAPRGFLLLWEITEPQLDFDITDALLMNPLEDEKRSRGNPFLSKEQWQKALENHGFVKVTALSETAAFGHDVLVAQVSPSAGNNALTAFSVTLEQQDTDKTTQNLSGKKPDIADWFYIPSWKRSMLPQLSHQNIGATESGCWLVFIDDCNLGDKIVKKLELAGQDVISIRIGEQFTSNSQQSLYTLNPQHKEHYDTLIAELCTIGKIPHKIVHLWNVTPNTQAESTIASLEQSEYLGLYSLIFLAQALGTQNLQDAVKIEVVSNDMQAIAGSEMLCPEKALILGPVKVIGLEYPLINCRSVDVVLPDAETWQQEQLIDWLLVELKSQNSDQIIAYRGCYRWVQDLEAVRLAENSGNSRLRPRGVYLITGGLGGVGLVLAEYLAEAVQAKLVLIRRSAFPDQEEWEEWLTTHDQQDSVSIQIRKLQAIKALGAEVMVVSADVANLEQMAIAVEKTKQQFGQIHGVIHAAGVPGGGTIQLRMPESLANDLASKVKGTLVLDALFKNTQLDFLILCSALSSLRGTAGMVDYTAENDFLDAFAHYSVFKHSRFTTSINWDRWNNLGMAVAVEARHREITGEAFFGGMASFEGVEAFKRILSSRPVPQVIVSTQDFQSLIPSQDSAKSEEEISLLNESKPTHSRPNLKNDYIPAHNQTEQIVAKCWQQILGIDRVGIHDNFFELGGDSLMSIQLISLLKKELNIQIPIVSIYERPTVSSLAELLSCDLDKTTIFEQNRSRGEKRRQKRKSKEHY